MSAQFVKDILGVVLLNNARHHKKRVEEIATAATLEENLKLKKGYEAGRL